MRFIFVTFQDNTDIIGVKYLHAYILANGYDSSILLLPNDYPQNIQAAVDYIKDLHPDAIGLSAMSYEFQRANYFAYALREKIVSCPIIFGGIHATADPESCLGVADIVVRGEGEETLLDLLRVLNRGNNEELAKIKGIVLKERDKIINTGVRHPVQFLNELPYPRHLPESMFVVDKRKIRSIKYADMYKRYARYQGTFVSIATSRGCPFACNYCSNSMLKSYYGQVSIRIRSVESVIDEISREISDFKDILYVNFTDDCFMMHDWEWILDFCKRYKKEVGIPFVARSTPKHTDKEKMALLKDAGLGWIFMGLQTGSDRINQEVYGRYTTAEEFLKAAEVISRLRISPWYDVIVDNPYETEDDYLQTIDVLLRTARPFEISLFSLDFFPGTELLRRTKQDKIPIPVLGSKSYTQPEFTLINCFIRMSAVFPSILVKMLVRKRKTVIFRMLTVILYGPAMFLEAWTYMWLVYQSNDFKFIRTLRVIKAFFSRSIDKLLLRKIA